MRILVAGAAGMLGRDVCLLAGARGHQVTAADRSTLDIVDPAACRRLVPGHDVVVNAAAWTDVDGAEAHEDLAVSVNAVGAGHLAAAAAESGAGLLHVSTDYVFDGSGRTPYREDTRLAPISAYGRSKAAGEVEVRRACPGAVLVRTAWLYGAFGRNFVSTMLRLAEQRDTVEVVDDQWGQPTWSRDVAGFLLDLAERDRGTSRREGQADPWRPRTFHATSEGSTTWFGLAREVFGLAGLDPERVRPTSSARFTRPAARPAWSVLGHDATAAAGLVGIGPWRDRLVAAWPHLVAAGQH